MTTVRTTFWVCLLSLALVVVGGATVVEIRVTASSDGRVVLEESADLRPHTEAGYERRIQLASGEEMDLSLKLGLTETRGGSADVSVSGILAPVAGGAATTWTSRSFTIANGETASFSSEPGGELRYDVSILGGRRVELKTTVVLHEVTSHGTRRLSEHRVRLAGPESTEVIFSSPGGGGLIVRLTPRARDADGATLALDIEATGEHARDLASIQLDEVELGWNDVVRIAGLTGPGSQLLVDIKPER